MAWRITVLLYTDEPLLAAGVADLLASGTEFEYLGSCSGEGQLLESAVARKPDLILIDYRRLTLASLRLVRSARKDAALAVWLRTPTPEFAMQANELGINAVLSKTAPLEDLLAALRRLAGHPPLPIPDIGGAAGRKIRITRREGQILSGLSRGLSNGEIARRLGLTVGTIKVYLSRLYVKTRAKDRLDLALAALRNQNDTGSDAGAAPGQGPLDWPDTLVLPRTAPSTR